MHIHMYIFCLCSYNVSRLEDWCHDNHLREAVEDQLRPIKEAAKLLQLRKATDKDALAVVDLCTHLSSLQVSTCRTTVEHRGLSCMVER